ncbi:AGB-1 [Polychytrium aggregatum]|uniref:AGB-1 n=1 Tax=Polychytrium aggregatum TaxID=110093 RepID=UPI0022FE2126|nr:AGB-1 [Polychytrium aggregatum]KAI9190531.1 AGB-1 [Polychytrium aggregatum]
MTSTTTTQRENDTTASTPSPIPQPSIRLEIQKFKMTDIRRDSTLCCIAPRGSGKSFFVRDLMYHLKDIPRGIVFSGTEHANPFFSSFIPDTYIHPRYQSEIVKKIIDKQAERLRVSHEGKTVDNGVFIIMDDCLASANCWKNDPTLCEILMNGRHYNIFYALTMQYPLGIPPNLRSNIDYSVIFREPKRINRKLLWEHYASVIPSLDLFNDIMDQCTGDYNCIVIKNSSTSNNFMDCVFWYKAEAREDFRVGCERFWRSHLDHYRPEAKKHPADIKKTSELVSLFAPSKKKIHITIHKTDPDEDDLFA